MSISVAFLSPKDSCQHKTKAQEKEEEKVKEKTHRFHFILKLPKQPQIVFTNEFLA